MAVFKVGTENAKKLAKMKWWEGCKPEEIVSFQLFCLELCTPMNVFTDSLTKALGFSVDVLYLGLKCKEIKFKFISKYNWIRIPLKLMLILDDMLVK